MQAFQFHSCHVYIHTHVHNASYWQQPCFCQCCCANTGRENLGQTEHSESPLFAIHSWHFECEQFFFLFFSFFFLMADHFNVMFSQVPKLQSLQSIKFTHKFCGFSFTPQPSLTMLQKFTAFATTTVLLATKATDITTHATTSALWERWFKINLTTTSTTMQYAWHLRVQNLYQQPPQSKALGATCQEQLATMGEKNLPSVVQLNLKPPPAPNNRGPGQEEACIQAQHLSSR